MSDLIPAPRRFTRRTALAIGIPFLMGLLVLTMYPSRVEDTVPSILDTVLGTLRDLGWTWMGFNTLEVLSNMLVFVPVGILAFVLLPRRLWLLSFLVGPALSLVIETVQLFALPERAATFADLLANSMGSTIGVGLALLFTILFAPHPSPTLEAS